MPCQLYFFTTSFNISNSFPIVFSTELQMKLELNLLVQLKFIATLP